MNSTHRLHATLENGDSVRADISDTGLYVLTVDQPREFDIRKRTMLFLSKETFRSMGALIQAFDQNEGAFILPEDRPIEF